MTNTPLATIFSSGQLLLFYTVQCYDIVYFLQTQTQTCMLTYLHIAHTNNCMCQELANFSQIFKCKYGGLSIELGSYYD